MVLWFLNRDAPEEANLAAAVEGVSNSSAASEPPAQTSAVTETSPTTSSPDSTSPQTTTPETTSGTELATSWTVTNEIGEFSYEEATGTFAGFRIEEELQGLGSNVAVGRTEAVTGSLSLDGTQVLEAEFSVDMTSISTNDSRRDNGALEAMKVEEFPAATFQLGEPIELGEIPEEGATITATANGEFTIAGVTNPVEIPIEAQLTPQGLVVVGSTEITMSDYDVEVPQAPVLLSASEIATIEVQLWFTPAEGT
ncbi:MAG: hypothetical protein GEU79_18070 [Acidimicrobiia bacterium]|nr:hypothetical protein [Acidimicrobiia bacterium]